MPVLSRPFSPVQPEQLQGESTFAESLQAAIGETWATGPTGSLITSADLEEAEYGRQEEAGAIFMATRGGAPRVIEPPKLSPRIPLESAKQQIKDAGLEGQIPLEKYPNGIRTETLKLLIDMNRDKLKRQTISSEYDGWSPDVAGMVIGSIIDPANVALSFVPVVREARYAKLLAQAGGSVAARAGVRAGVGAVEGLAGSIAAEPFIYYGQQQWRNDYDAYDSLLNVAGGAAFGSLLHAGAGLARDAFGNPVVNELPTGRRVFADPDVVTAQQFQAKAREMGVSESVAKSLTPKAVRDSVTGYFDGRADAVKLDTLTRAQAHVKATGEPAYYVSGDIANLGGLNAHVGNVAEAANVHYRALAEILDGEVRKTGGDVVPLRTGGDEISLVVVNADAQSMEVALNAVDSRIKEYVRANGLEDIANPKGGDRGIGLHSGVAVISPDAKPADIFARADAGVDASKKGLKYVNRKPTETTGAAAPEGQARRAGEGIAAADERIRLGGDPFHAVRPFIAGLDQDTQAAALRMAVAQAVDGRPIDVTPTMLTDPQFRDSEGAYRDAVNGAQRNAEQVDGANEAASRAADEVPAPAKSMLEDAKQRLADEEQMLRDRGGDPADLDVDAEDLKLTQTAVKAATLCMMRSNG